MLYLLKTQIEDTSEKQHKVQKMLEFRKRQDEGT